MHSELKTISIKLLFTIYLPNNMKENLQKLIIYLIKQKKVTQKEISNNINVSEALLSSFLRNKKEISNVENKIQLIQEKYSIYVDGNGDIHKKNTSLAATNHDHTSLNKYIGEYKAYYINNNQIESESSFIIKEKGKFELFRADTLAHYIGDFYILGRNIFFEFHNTEERWYMILRTPINDAHYLPGISLSIGDIDAFPKSKLFILERQIPKEHKKSIPRDTDTIISTAFDYVMNNRIELDKTLVDILTNHRITYNPLLNTKNISFLLGNWRLYSRSSSDNALYTGILIIDGMNTITYKVYANFYTNGYIHSNSMEIYIYLKGIKQALITIKLPYNRKNIQEIIAGYTSTSNNDVCPIVGSLYLKRLSEQEKDRICEQVDTLSLEYKDLKEKGIIDKIWVKKIEP